MLDNAARIEAKVNLAQFTGTENYYRHPLFKFTFTDGVEYMAKTYDAFWLIDVCMSHAAELIRKYGADSEQCGLLVCKLRRDPAGDGAVFVVEDGDYNELARQVIEYTDFPEPEFTMWFQNGVLFLTSEY